MLRAGQAGEDPVAVLGLTAADIAQVKDGGCHWMPISDMVTGARGTLYLMYGEDDAKLSAVYEDAKVNGVIPSAAAVEGLPAAELTVKPSPVLVCTVGLPRSGKSTWAMSQPYPCVSPDAIRLAMHGRRYWEPAEPLVWATAKLMVRSLFAAGHSTVILDATNYSSRRRQEWVSPEWETRWKLFPTDPAVCRERARAGGRLELIPVIDRMTAGFDSLSPDQKLW